MKLFRQILEEISSSSPDLNSRFDELFPKLIENIETIEDFSDFLKYLTGNLSEILQEPLTHSGDVFLSYFASSLVHELNPERQLKPINALSGYGTIAWSMYMALSWE